MLHCVIGPHCSIQVWLDFNFCKIVRFVINLNSHPRSLYGFHFNGLTPARWLWGSGNCCRWMWLSRWRFGGFSVGFDTIFTTQEVAEQPWQCYARQTLWTRSSLFQSDRHHRVSYICEFCIYVMSRHHAGIQTGGTTTS